MNIFCKVCGEKAAGFHFGAFTCEGCKSFFGRCCNNMSIIGECRKNKECVIDKKNRTSCKACRLQKCLLVGMSKSGSRYGRRSNWFKQYFQENELRDKNSGKNKGSVRIVEGKSLGSAFSSPSNKESDFTDISAIFNTKNEKIDLFDQQSSISSHFYLNCFPLNLNRFISYTRTKNKNKAKTAPDVSLSSILSNTDIRIDNYFEKFLDNKIFSNIILNPENPLDLSQKNTRKLDSVEYVCNKDNTDHDPRISDNSKKLLPLNLSVK